MPKQYMVTFSIKKGLYGCTTYYARTEHKARKKFFDEFAGEGYWIMSVDLLN